MPYVVVCATFSHISLTQNVPSNGYLPPRPNQAKQAAGNIMEQSMMDRGMGL